MGAYRRGRATWLNVGQVAHLASEAFEARQHVLTVSLDLQDAYNMVSVPTLVRILLDEEVNPYLVRWILAAFQSRRCALKCGRWLSEWTNVMMALPQGSPLSPVCFNAYTLPIADMTLPLNMKLFTFADDLLLVGTGKSLDLLQSQMQETLDSLNVICQRASMTVNPAKASSCVFSLSRRTLPPCQLRYAGQPILSEDTVTHLGITLDKGLSFNTHVEKIVSSCTRSLGVLKMAKRKGVNQARLLQLYRSLVQSRLLYGAEVITASASALEKLDRVQTSALRIVTGCTRDTARATLRYMANLQSVPQQVETLRVTAVARALESPGHPLHEVARSLVTRPPLRRLQRTGWLRRAADTLRELRGRHQFRSGPQFEPTPDDVAKLWTIISRHSLDRSCREWPPGMANAAFGGLLAELMSEGDALLATDGSVTREPPPERLGLLHSLGRAHPERIRSCATRAFEHAG